MTHFNESVDPAYHSNVLTSLKTKVVDMLDKNDLQSGLSIQIAEDLEMSADFILDKLTISRDKKEDSGWIWQLTYEFIGTSS